MKAVILHGGQGTRLRPLTHTGPKQLIKIAGKPVSQWGMEALKEAGITEFGIVLGNNHPEKVVEYYGDGSKLGIKITYIYQGEPLGLAHAVMKAKDFVGDDDFIVYLGDNVILEGLDKLTNFHGSASILLASVDNPQRFGVAVVKEDKIIKLVEKPKERISDLALVGVYAFTSDIFSAISNIKPSWRGELEITDAIQNLIDQGKEVNFHVIRGWWKDTGTPEDLLDANMKLLDTYLKEDVRGGVASSKIKGRVFISPEAKVINSELRGPVYIGRGSIVENSFLGPFTTVGDNCQIRDSEISNSLVLDGSTLNGVDLIDSIIGQNSTLVRRKQRFHGSKFVVGENSSVELE
jgi:glucose-1-phosphate thymidylyltransferase